ncbi:MAG: HD-GYP domain-containing protein, partial [bacterium]
AVARLILHAYTWPGDIYGDEAPKWIAANLLCDLGMVEIPETFWIHEDDLDDRQRDEVKKHPGLGVERLESVRGLPEDCLELIKCHHYRGSGEGYPTDTDDWSTERQKLALVDAVESMTAPRLRRDPHSPSNVFQKLNDIFTDVDQKLVQDLSTKVGSCPPGSMIRLDNGDVALVEEANESDSGPVYRPLIMEGEKITDIGKLMDPNGANRTIESTPRARVAPWSVRRVRWKYDDSLSVMN